MDPSKSARYHLQSNLHFQTDVIKALTSLDSQGVKIMEKCCKSKKKPWHQSSQTMPVKTLRNASAAEILVGGTERLLDNEKYCTPCRTKPIAHHQLVPAAT